MSEGAVQRYARSFRLAPSLQVGSPDYTPSPKLAVTNAAADDALLVYDSKPSIVRLYNPRTMTKAKQSWIGAKQITALEPVGDGVDNVADLVTASPAGLQTWRDAFDSRCTGPLRPIRHIRTQSLPTALCTIRTRLVAGSASGRIAVYGLHQKQPLISQYDAHGGRRLHQLVALGGASMASAADADAVVRIWDVERYAQIATIAAAGNDVRCLAYRPRDRLGACGGDDRRLSFWASDAAAVVKAIGEAHDAPIVSCRFRDRTPYMTSLDHVGIVKIWDCRMFGIVQTMATSVSGGSIAIVGDRLVVVGSGPGASVYTAAADSRRCRPAAPRSTNAFPTAPGAALFCAESDRIVLGAGRGLLIWNVADGALVMRTPDVCAGNITAACLRTPSAAFVADDLGFVYLVDVRHGRLLNRLS